jgi:TonB-linked SusC/RagA family outer membrane protein
MKMKGIKSMFSPHPLCIQPNIRKIAYRLLFTPILLVHALLLYPQVTGEKTTVLDLNYQKPDPESYNGSVYRIGGEQIRNLPVSNIGNAIAGLVPGFLSRQQSGGMVNENPSMWIRGIYTDSSADGVFLLVDGQERTFGTLSPYEIEEIIVLKDAAAIALYGMRAANGAILVNTRKGKSSERPQVEFTAQWIDQQPVGLLNRLGALDYATHYNAALLNDGQEPLYSDYYLSQYRHGANNELYPDIDWLERFMKPSSLVQRYNLSLSGGKERVRYFINGGFITQNGLFKTENENDYNTNNRVDRYNIRSNIEFDLTPTTLLSLDLYGWTESQNRPNNNSAGVYTTLLTTPPNAFPLYYTDGDAYYIDQTGNSVSSKNDKIIAGDGKSANAWALLNRAGYGTYKATYGSFRAKVSQNLDMILKGLSVATCLSMDSYTAAVTNRTKSFAYYYLTDPGNNVLQKNGTDGKMVNDIVDKNSYRRTTFEGQVLWIRSFDRHHLSVSALYSQYEESNEVSIPQRQQNINGWIGYNYDKRYGVDLLMSYAGNWKFPKNRRFGYFPVVAAGWTVSNETFFTGLKQWVSYLKLRGSFGLLGNHRGVAAHSYIGALSNVAGVYQFGNAMTDAAGYEESIVANPNITWEKVQKSNLGADVRLLDERLDITAEYFADKRTDIYMQNNRISSFYGLNTEISENIGKMKSDGFDVGIRWNDRIGNIGYHIGGTFCNTNNTLQADGQADQPYPWMQNTGYPQGVVKGYIAEGFFNSYEEIAAAPYHTFNAVKPGDIRYKDINGDGLIDQNDQAPVGNFNVPKMFYSMILGVSCKGFGLSATFTGAGRFTRNINSSKVAYPFYNNGTIYEHQTDYWTPENPEGDYPRISLLGSENANNNKANTFWVKEVRYLRLHSISLTYDFSPSLLKNTFLRGLQLFANACNVHTWSNFQLTDPDADVSAANMPLTRNINLGCSLKF